MDIQDMGWGVLDRNDLAQRHIRLPQRYKHDLGSSVMLRSLN
jgi:hypothetical protein